MSEQRKPIKRSEQLAPLSREHHEGLLLVWKIKQGIANGTDHQLIADYIKWFWENHLNRHFMAEESAFNEQLFPNDELVHRMKEEHQQIEALIHVNESIADINLIKELANLVNDHIRFEERELFPYVEQKLSKEELDKIHNQLAKEEKPAKIWPHEFWTRK